MFSTEVYQRRRSLLMRKVGHGLILLPGNVELPFNGPANSLPFRQDSTFLYYIGVDEPGMFAVLDCDTGHTVLFGHDVSIDDIIWTGDVPSVGCWAARSGMDAAMEMDCLYDYLGKHSYSPLHYICPYQKELCLLMSEITRIPLQLLKEKQSILLIHSVVEMRRIKDPLELLEMEKAVCATADMHCAAMRLIGLGSADPISTPITGRDVVSELYRMALRKGYYHSFAPIATVHGEVFHNHGYDYELSPGRLMLIDAGVESLEHYAGDLTRTMPVGGKFSTRQRHIYDIVCRANMGVLEMARPGVEWSRVHNGAAAIIAEGLKDLGLMRGSVDDIVATGAYALFFPHGLGHLVGLDVHDMEALGEDYVGYSSEVRRSSVFGPCHLRFALPLEENMVVTDEPGIYFIPQLMEEWRRKGLHADFVCYSKLEEYLDFGGIRIEDDLQITASGCRVMGSPVPKLSSEVEEYMAKSACCGLK